MGLGTIITMGVIGYEGSLLSSLLYTQGEAKKAQLLDIASTAILITFVVGCVSEAIKALSNLV